MFEDVDGNVIMATLILWIMVLIAVWGGRAIGFGMTVWMAILVSVVTLPICFAIAAKMNN